MVTEWLAQVRHSMQVGHSFILFPDLCLLSLLRASESCAGCHHQTADMVSLAHKAVSQDSHRAVKFGFKKRKEKLLLLT